VKVYLNRTSNAPQRVRIALALKRISAEEIYVDLERAGGGQQAEAFGAINPQRLVPVLVDGEQVIRQSLAIIEYLEEKNPQPALLPADRVGRAHVRSLAQVIACDGQPLVNLRVRLYLTSALGLSAAQRTEWLHHWLTLSLKEYEAALSMDPATGRFSHSNSPTLADVCLFPQVLMAQRFAIPISQFSNVSRIFDACMALSEFRTVADEAALP